MRRCTACEREHPSDPEISRNKNANEAAWNILEDRRRKELEKVLSETDNLTEQEQLYLDCQNQNRNHTLNIRFNNAECERIENQSQALGMKKSAYVRDCVMAHEKMIFDRDSRFLSLDALKAKRDKLISEKSAKNMEYTAENKKFDQMEKCRAQIENYQSRRHVAERSMGRKKGELE